MRDAVARAIQVKRWLVETGESRTPRPESFPLECATGLSGACFSLPGTPCRPEVSDSQPVDLGPRYRRCAGCTSTYGAHSLPSRRDEGERGGRVRPPGLLAFRQLLFCRLVYGVDGTPACNSARPPPVETTRPHVLFRHVYCSTRRPTSACRGRSSRVGLTLPFVLGQSKSGRT